MKKILILQLSIAFWYASVAQIQATKQEVKSAAKQAISDFIIPSVSDNDETIDTVYSMTKNGNTVLYEVVFSSGAGIANATLYDLQGRVVGANNDSPLPRPCIKHPTPFIDPFIAPKKTPDISAGRFVC